MLPSCLVRRTSRFSSQDARIFSDLFNKMSFWNVVSYTPPPHCRPFLSSFHEKQFIWQTVALFPVCTLPICSLWMSLACQSYLPPNFSKHFSVCNLLMRRSLRIFDIQSSSSCLKASDMDLSLALSITLGNTDLCQGIWSLLPEV